MILPDRVAETIQGLRHLAVHPTLEGAAQLIEDWDERQQMYDGTDTGWARREQKILHGIWEVFDVESE